MAQYKIDPTDTKWAVDIANFRPDKEKVFVRVYLCVFICKSVYMCACVCMYACP
jgi:hypothetical protein